MAVKGIESRAFGKAMVEQLGITAEGVTDVHLNSELSTMLTVSVTIRITADDLAAVAERMKANALARKW